MFNLSKIVKGRRDFLQISQEDLSEMANVGLATVKDIERGKANPSLRTIEKIFTVLGLELHSSVRKIE